MTPKPTSRFRERPKMIRPTIVVVCEGEKTEVQYLKYWHAKYRTAVNLILPDPHGSDPLTIVRCAIDKKATYADEGGNQTFWCVGDQDEHVNLEEAVTLANANGIHYCLSIPCLELWFVLHFENQTGHISKDKVQSKCRKHLIGYVKRLSDRHLVQLHEEYETARDRARALDKWHSDKFVDDDFPNPSTNIWNLVEQIKH